MMQNLAAVLPCEGAEEKKEGTLWPERQKRNVGRFCGRKKHLAFDFSSDRDLFLDRGGTTILEWGFSQGLFRHVRFKNHLAAIRTVPDLNRERCQSSFRCCNCANAKHLIHKACLLLPLLPGDRAPSIAGKNAGFHLLLAERAIHHSYILF